MDNRNSVTFKTKPALRNPYIVCGVDGWVNGGDVSVEGIKYLIRQFKGVKFAEMATSRYHIYQVPGVESLRPVFKMQDGLIAESHLPSDEFYYALNDASDHDLVVFLGSEPSLNWEEYADAVVTLARDLGGSRLYTFGGVLDRTPYTREPRISCACTSAKVKDEMEKYNVSFSSREGPATFNTMLLYACKKKGLDGATLTVRAPYYPEVNVAIEYSPKSVKAVLMRLNHLMRLSINFEELNKAIKELEGKLDFMRRQNPQFNAYIEALEKDYVEMPYQEPLDISPGEAIRFAEEFLRENKDHRQGE
jgi:proteasome assembly chaperone (PAC2) family protein